MGRKKKRSDLTEIRPKSYSIRTKRLFENDQPALCSVYSFLNRYEKFSKLRERNAQKTEQKLNNMYKKAEGIPRKNTF